MLSALCAAIGFFAFVPTDYRGLAELGIIAGSGMFIALVANLTVTPALLWLLTRRSGGRTADVTQLRVNPFAWTVRNHSRTVLIGAAALGVIGCAALPFVRFDVNPLNLKDPTTESVSTFLDLTEDVKTTPYRINILAEDQAAADALADRLERLELVDNVITLSSFVPRNQDEKLDVIDTMALFVLPVLEPLNQPEPPGPAARQMALDAFLNALRAYLDQAPGIDAALTAAVERLATALSRIDERAQGDPQVLAELDERLTTFLPDWIADLRAGLNAGMITLADLPESLSERWVAEGGQTRIEVLPAIDIGNERAMRAFAEAVQEVAPRATGTPVVLTEAGGVVVSAFIKATVITIVLITALLIVIYRRLDDVVLTLAPLVLTAVLTLAVAVALGLPINFANIIVLPLLFGLGVSSSIHLVIRRRRGAGLEDVMTTSTPRAVTFSALTTIASFGSLAVSPHRGMASMGQLLTIAILLMLVSTLVVLPSLMNVLSRRPSAAGAPAEREKAR